MKKNDTIITVNPINRKIDWLRNVIDEMLKLMD